MRNVSKFPLIPAFLFLACLVIAWGLGSQEKSAETAETASPVKIGFSLDSLKERWLRDKDEFVKQAEALGAEVMVQSASGNDALQMAQARMMMTKGADILVIVPHNLKFSGRIVNMAHSEFNTRVIAYDRLIRDCELDLYISFDNEKVGRLQAEALLKRVPKGNYVIIGGAGTDNNALMLHKGQMDALKTYIEKGDINIVADQWANDWLASEGSKIMAAALLKAGDDIQAVLASNDQLAGAAIEVLDKKGLAGKVAVSGQDADLEACRRIVAGTQTMTVYKPIDKLAETAAEVAVSMVRGEKINHLVNGTVNNGYMEVPAILLDPIAVDRENIDDVIIDGGFHPREKVYENQSL